MPCAARALVSYHGLTTGAQNVRACARTSICVCTWVRARTPTSALARSRACYAARDTRVPRARRALTVSLSAEEAHALGVLHVPDADRGVVGARGDERGVRVEGGAAHVRVVAEHHADGLRLVGRPEAERAVVAAGGEKGADRREGDRPDGRRVRVVTNKARALRQAPQPCRAVLRRTDQRERLWGVEMATRKRSCASV
eukprot:5650292-Pleurochrysis_carterae.AAC.1